jgi:threonine dehydrogenase-like Zn-dependent dehydrogenase
MAKAGGAITINFEEESVVERLNELTRGKGPERCIDAVGLEAHATGSVDSMYDGAKQAMMLETDRPHVLREMMYVCRPAGNLHSPRLRRAAGQDSTRRRHEQGTDPSVPGKRM